MVVNWCICNGRIGVGEGYRFLFCLRRGVTCLLGKNKGIGGPQNFSEKR